MTVKFELIHSYPILSAWACSASASRAVENRERKTAECAPGTATSGGPCSGGQGRKPRQHRGNGQKNTNPEGLVCAVLVVGRNLAPNLSNSAPYNRFELLRKGAESSPCCWQSYQFPPAVGISDAPETSRQFDSIFGIEPASAFAHPTFDQAVTNRSRNARRPWS